MKPEVKSEIAAHMIDLGLNMIGKGIANSTIDEITNPYGHAMSIVHIAHGAEIALKARIVEEHPLLIFSKVPKMSQSTKSSLGFLELLEGGQTIMYSELPEKVWSSTGYSIRNQELYKEFGKIRNQIVHFAVPDIDLADLSLKFAFEVIEPAINEWWDLTLLEYCVNYDLEIHEYIFDHFDRLNLKVNYELDGDRSLKKIIAKS